jgi:hypothetical protein
VIDPVMLGPGAYSVVAANYGGGGNNERNFNTGYAPYSGLPSPMAFDSAGGAVVMETARWQWGNDLPATFFTILYPDFMSDWGMLPPDNHPMPTFGAGTFDFTSEDPTHPPGPFRLWLSATPTQIWPPHGQKVPVRIAAVAETEDGRQWPQVASRIVSVSCNEVRGRAAKDKRNAQWRVTGDLSLSVVAKRLPGRMNFRIYTIKVEAEGEDGYRTTGEVRVVVPPAAPRAR